MAAGALLLLILLTPTSAAQLPPEVAGGALFISVECPDTMLEPAYAGQDEVMCRVRDLSRDSVYLPDATSGTGATPHQIMLTARPRAGFENVTGYQVIVTRPIIDLYGGDVVDFGVNVKTTPLVNAQDYPFELVAEYTHSSAGYNQTIVVPFSAQVAPYDFALLSWAGNQAQRAGQDEVVIYSVLVQNTGVYPDSYRFSVKGAADLFITTPSDVYVPAGESRVVNFSVLTPRGKLYELGRSEAISVKVNSMGFDGSGGTGVYSTTAVLQIRGVYIPVYWIPLLLVGLVSMGVVVRGARESREHHRLERGSPREVELTPRQAVLLAELRRTDPAAYREKRKALLTVYRERQQDYRAHRKERLAADREEARQARVEFLAQKKARKAQRIEERKQQKLAAIAAKREAKLLAKKEKVLAKARKKLEKAQKKQAKIDAKVAAKQAKLDAKQAKKDAAAAKKAEKEAKKAAKKQK